MALRRRPAGDPDRIRDWTFNGTGWSAPRIHHYEGGTVTAPTPERDPNVVRQLNARRAVRQSHRSCQAVPAY